MDDAAEKARRKKLAALPFPEKIKILRPSKPTTGLPGTPLEKLREVNRIASKAGLRKPKASKPR